MTISEAMPPILRTSIYALAMTVVAVSATAQTHCTGSSSSAVQPVCAAAENFLSTLSATQKSGVVYPFNRVTAATKWSNLPCASSCHNGLQFSTLSSTQLNAALGVAQAALSAAGYGTFDGIRKTDTFLGTSRGPAYHEGIYFIAFIGTPSSSGEWILQLGGHHYALNFYFRGATESPTPYFTGVEPLSVTLNGISYSPLKTKSDAMKAMLASLTAPQLAAAKLGVFFDDVLLGPGDDDLFPAPQGLNVSTLSATQKALLVAAMGAWVNDAPASVAAKFLSAYTTETALADTYIAWATATDLTTQGSYIRIDGPRAWMEIIVQNYPVAGNQGHYHAIWRDQSLDYGGDGTTVAVPGTLSFSSPAFAVSEGAGSASIEVQRTGGSDGAVSVAYAVTGGTALDGTDFQSVSGVLNWNDGDAAGKTFTIPIVNNAVIGNSKTVIVTLSGPTGGAVLGTNTLTTLTIDDDDQPRRRAVRH
ncbi:MAG TPA: DUF3500 domain-containing protein [Thermoanaerobaculia bacterium]|nr:DUF3500 domain-containing protein [Thermoanaerobaculia bacterium]